MQIKHSEGDRFACRISRMTAASYSSKSQLHLRSNWRNAGALQIRKNVHQRQASRGSSNKPSEMLLNQQTYEYLLQHTQEPEVLFSLRRRTSEQWPTAKQMQVSPEQGRFLSWLVSTIRAAKAIELGVFTGYSAVCIAKGLQSDGSLVACESDERPLDLARQAFSEAGVSHKIDLKVGKALTSLQALLEEGRQSSFDFAFVDADKGGYHQYHELLLQLVCRGGIIAYDNLLWYGAVADEQDTRKTTAALRLFNDHLLQDSRIDYSLIPVGDGIGLCRVL